MCECVWLGCLEQGFFNRKVEKQTDHNTGSSVVSHTDIIEKAKKDTHSSILYLMQSFGNFTHKA